MIGVPLPMDRVQRGFERAAAQLDAGAKAAFDAAEAIMTTDRVPKLSAYAFYHDERKYVVGGIAKGSGMIAPNMATMLAFVATDYPLSRDGFATLLRELLRRELQHDLGRRRHVDQRCGVRVRAGAARTAPRRRSPFGRCARVCRDLAAGDGRGRRGRDQNARDCA